MAEERFTILFQGDSITDTGRARGVRLPNEPSAMGNGYAYLAMCRLLADHPRRNLAIYNRGVSGDQVPDLQARWRKDCLDLAPDVLSILIGVNDLWHKLEGRADGTTAEYESGYRRLLEDTRTALPRTRIIIGDPFVLRCGAVSEHWFPEFDERRAIAARIARDVGALFVPFQSSFDAALAAGSVPMDWAADGVHPTPGGHQRMADAWLEVAAPTLTFAPSR
jgi:lysophospholipase L1-like esterase